MQKIIFQNVLRIVAPVRLMTAHQRASVLLVKTDSISRMTLVLVGITKYPYWDIHMQHEVYTYSRLCPHSQLSFLLFRRLELIMLDLKCTYTSQENNLSSPLYTTTELASNKRINVFYQLVHYIYMLLECSVDNCKRCSAASTCDTCNDGYRKKDGKCVGKFLFKYPVFLRYV